jgi:hypothetical protein
MNAPAEAFRCQALAKEIAAELRAKYDLKAWLAGQRVLITKFDHDPRVGSARHKRCSWPIGARQELWLRAHPKPPQRKLQRWRLAHHSTLASRP